MSQIENDIRNWSRDRLVQWFKDCVMRYKLAGVSDRRATANLIMDLWMLSVSMLVETGTDPHEAGGKFEVLMKSMTETIKDEQSRNVRKP